MRRWTFHIFSVLSLLLFLILAWLWALSHIRQDGLWVRIPYGSGAQRSHLKLDANSFAGQVQISWQVWSQAHYDLVRSNNSLAERRFFHASFPVFSRDYVVGDSPTIWKRIGFNYFHGPYYTSIYFPYWFACGMSILLPAIWLFRHRRSRRRASRGMCPSCGCDLRATPAQCPECGKTAPAAC